MTSIKDLLQEENEAERQLKEAEQESEELIRNAKSRAREVLKAAKMDNIAINRLTEESKQRIAEQKTEITVEFQARFVEAESRYRKNLDNTVKLILDKALGL